MIFNKYFIVLFLLFVTAISCRRDKEDKIKDARFLDQVDLSALSATDKKVVLDSLFVDAMTDENSKDTRLYLLELAEKLDMEEVGEDQFLKILNRVRTFSKEESDSLSLAKTFTYLGRYYDAKMEFDSTYFFYQQAEKWYVSLNDSANIAQMALGKASILYDFGFYTESEVETIRVLRYIKKEQKPLMAYQSYQLLGLVLCELKSIDESLNYYKLTEAELEKLTADGTFAKDEYALAYGALYNNIAGVYEVNDDFVQAVEYYKKGLNLVGIDNSPDVYSALLNNSSFARMQIRDTVGVLKNLKIAERIRLKNGNTQEVITSKLNIGEYYFKQNKPEVGLGYIQESYDLAVEMNSELDQKHALRFLVEHDTINKSKYTKEYVRIIDKIQTTERATRNKFARIVYETEDMINKNEILKERNRKIIIVSAIVVGFLIFLIMLLRLSARNKRLLLLQRQQESNQQIYRLVIEQQQKTHKAKVGERNRIAKELHDGIVNRIFTTRFNLMQLESKDTAKKNLLVQELVKAEEEVRTISHELVSHQILEDKTFEEVVKKLIEKQQNSFGTHFELSIDRAIAWESITSDVRMHIFRILQETLQNVNKYSKAKNCTIWILKTNDKVKLRISDDGIGFDAAKVKHGLGFKNLIERVDEINGEFVLETEEGKGTTLEIIF